MKLLTRPTIAFLTTFVLFSFAVSSAHAVPTLRLTQGASVVTIVDGGAGDLSPFSGHVASVGAVGSFVHLTGGLSKPQTGSSTNPDIDLNSQIFSTALGGTLTIELTDTDFTSPSSFVNLLSAIGGTTQGVVAWAVYADSSNTAFGQGTLIYSGTSAPGSPASPLSFAGPSSNFLFGPTSGPYSLTQVVTITHQGAATSSFNINTVGSPLPLPEPNPLALISLGLFILGGYQLKTPRYLV